MRMLRWIHGFSLMDHIRNEEIMKAATVQPITTHLMQKRLRWYGHVRRRDDSHMTRTVLDMEVGVRSRGRPTLIYMDTIRRDIKKNELMHINSLDSKDWGMAVFRGTHWCGRAFNTRRWETKLIWMLNYWVNGRWMGKVLRNHRNGMSQEGALVSKYTRPPLDHFRCMEVRHVNWGRRLNMIY